MGAGIPLKIPGVIDTLGTRSLTLTVRFIPPAVSARAELRAGSKGCHGQGSAHVSTQHAPPQADAWISGADEHQERPARAETPACERPQTSDRQQRVTDRRFRPAERICRRAEFQQVYERGIRIHSRYSTVFALANEAGVGRLGIAATRKLGNAVVRNRAKRLIREVFRRNKLAPGFDIVVVPKRELLGSDWRICASPAFCARKRSRASDAQPTPIRRNASPKTSLSCLWQAQGVSWPSPWLSAINRSARLVIWPLWRRKDLPTGRRAPCRPRQHWCGPPLSR